MKNGRSKKVKELIDKIKKRVCKCEGLSMEIHYKISPFGLVGKMGVLRDTPIIEQLNTILTSTNYTLDTLRIIMNNLKSHSEETKKLKIANLK